MSEADLPADTLRLTAEDPTAPRYLVRSGQGYEAYRLAFRVHGQALRDRETQTRRHFLDEEGPVMREAAGLVMEAVTRTPAWLEELTGAPGPAVRAHLRAQRLTRIHELRRITARGVFENLIYSHADLDPQKLYAEVHEQLVQDSRGSAALWPTHLSFVTRPLASAGEILGAMAAAQILSQLETAWPNAWMQSGAGAWLREHLFADGARRAWTEKIENATGKPLGLDALARELEVEFTAPMPDEVEEISDEAVAEYFKDIDLSDIDRGE
jgi:hypothetical protein